MSLPKKDFSERDYKSTKSIRIRFPKIGSGWLPNNTITDFQWKDYCPAVFRHLQELDKIDSSDYVVSICGQETLRELSSLSSMGKSGSLLYLSQDDRFVIKTICKSEVKVLLTMLPNYCEHIQTHGHSLLNRFYGLHVVRPAGGLKVHFVVMKNILQSDLFIHRRFDLKGSSQGRSLSKVVGDECRTFKDLDLDLSFHLNPLMRYRLLAQIKHDCDFLEAEGVMDYSLLLGIHIEAVKGLTRSQSVSRSTNGRNPASGYSFPQDSSWRNINNQLIDGDDHQNAFRCDIRLGINTPARAVPRNMTGSVAAPYYNVKLHFGIIDILQGYNVAKRIEHAYKSLQFDPRKISSVKPKIYSTRFQEFLAEVFQPDELDFLPSKSTSS